MELGFEFLIGCVSGVLGCGVAYATIRLLMVRYYIVLRITEEARQRLEQLRVLSESADSGAILRKALAVYDCLWREIADENAKIVIRKHARDYDFDLQ